MDIEKNYDLSLIINDTERMVLEELGKRMERAEEEGLCDCQDCVVDTATIALNSLKPHYHASLMGNMYARAAESGDYAESVKKAVGFAIEKVKANPSHA
jgi:competence protein ComFB